MDVNNDPTPARNPRLAPLAARLRAGLAGGMVFVCGYEDFRKGCAMIDMLKELEEQISRLDGREICYISMKSVKFIVDEMRAGREFRQLIGDVHYLLTDELDTNFDAAFASIGDAMDGFDRATGKLP